MFKNVKIEDRLDHSNNEMLEFSILWRKRNRSERKLTALDFRRVEFGHLRDLLGKVPCDKCYLRRDETVQETKKAG